jgi:type IV pilus assembly protein PilW
MRTLPRGHAGFSLVELMVSIVVALFLVGGVVQMLASTRNTSADQSSLAQLQDDERLAMTLITNVVQSAGYYPNPLTMDAAGAFPKEDVLFPGQTLKFAADGQTLTGAKNTVGHTLVVRYRTSGTGSDNVSDCTGLQWTTGGEIVNTLTLDDHQNLICGVNNGTPAQLVSGVTNMLIWYGLKTDYTVDNNQVDMYVPTEDMTPTDWPNVMSVRITLTFVNPLYGDSKHPKPGQDPTIDFTRVIAIMNKAGVKT